MLRDGSKAVREAVAGKEHQPGGGVRPWYRGGGRATWHHGWPTAPTIMFETIVPTRVPKRRRYGRRVDSGDDGLEDA